MARKIKTEQRTQELARKRLVATLDRMCRESPWYQYFTGGDIISEMSPNWKGEYEVIGTLGSPNSSGRYGGDARRANILLESLLSDRENSIILHAKISMTGYQGWRTNPQKRKEIGAYVSDAG